MLTLVLDHLSADEKRLVKDLESHVRTVHRRDLATFLFEQLQLGRAYALDPTSVEFKGLTKWQ